jgi:chromosome segregation ATPase
MDVTAIIERFASIEDRVETLETEYGWRARAEAAEAEVARLNAALSDCQDRLETALLEREEADEQHEMAEGSIGRMLAEYDPLSEQLAQWRRLGQKIWELCQLAADIGRSAPLPPSVVRDLEAALSATVSPPEVL